MLVKPGYCEVELDECADVLNQPTVHSGSEGNA
jgi:hypothetical protein